MRALIRGGPALVIDRRGITDTSSAVPVGLVPWDQIADLRVWTKNRAEIVLVMVNDPAAVMEKATPRARLVMRANIGLTGTPVNIPMPSLPLTGAELIAEIARMAPNA